MPTLQEILDAGLLPDNGTGRPLFPGGVGVILHDGQLAELAVAGDAVRYADASGRILPEADRVAMSADTVFDIASLTKLFTATVLLRLVADGGLDLDRPIGETFPEWRGGDRSTVTLRHLLTHTSGLPAHARLWTVPAAERRTALLSMSLEARPGSIFTYSCLGYITAGWLAETATGTTLPELLARFVTGPLGLAETAYGPAPAERCAATEYEPYVERGMVRGSVHDENSWCLGGQVGNAGLFSTPADLGRFAEFLRADGALDGVRVLPADVAATMHTDQLPPDVDPGYRAGFGPRIGDRSFMGSLAEGGAIGHTGFTGTSIVVDRSRGVSVVLCANRVHPSRDWSLLGEVRCAVADRAAELAE
ncbi:MAG: serine hydrolase domain-containing protein [Mycobacteriales bacterium]